MNAATLDKMRKMQHWGMYRVFKTSVETASSPTCTPDQFIAELVDSERDERQNRSIALKIKNVRFRYRAALEDLYYNTDRNIEKNQVIRFADCTFIDRHEHLLITGSTGIGKSYIASALGYQACGLGYKAIYHNVPKLFSKLKISRADGSYLKEVAKIERQQLLILDDFGMQPFDAAGRAALMELIEDRHGKGALIITSQVPVSKWHDVIGEQTIAGAILDRIIHNAHHIELKGESLRKRKAVAQNPTG